MNLLLRRYFLITDETMGDPWQNIIISPAIIACTDLERKFSKIK